MILDLIVGAENFWSRAEVDIASARDRVFVQAMSFEGDATGWAVAEALFSSKATDRRVLVDDYTRVNINDRQVRSRAGSRDAALQAEARATDQMFRQMANSGISVRRTNPIAFPGLNYPARNHKKLLVADDIAYVGGINFSDHNFAWPDLMLRIEGADEAEFLATDFQQTFVGSSRLASADFGLVQLIALDGRENAAGFARVFDAIETAKGEIEVVSPYLTHPFTAALGRAAGRKVRVHLSTPWPNNKPLVRNALLSAARRYGFDVSLFSVMSHVKGMLIDGEKLILGSSNFDFASFAAEEEFLAITTDSRVIEVFQSKVLAPAYLNPVRIDASIRGEMAELLLRVAAIAIKGARGSKRQAVAWPRM